MTVGKALVNVLTPISSKMTRKEFMPAGYVTYSQITVDGRVSLSVGGSTLGAREVSSWLRDDLQMSSSSTDWWINQIKDIEPVTKKNCYVGSGNAHQVLSVKDYLYIYCELIEERQVVLTCESALKALSEYRNLVLSDWKSPEFESGQFEVEYEAEGDDALSLFRKLGGKFPAEL